MPEEQIVQTPETPVDDFAAYEAKRSAELRGEEIPEESSETPAEEQEVETASESETDEEAEQEAEAEEEQPKKKGGFQRRIDRLTREKAELADRLTRLEQQEMARQTAGKPATENGETPKQPAATAEAEPDPKNFETWEKYTAALVEYRLDARDKARQAEVERRTAAEQQQAARSKWNEQVEQGRDDYDDFDDVVVKSKRPVSPAVQAFIVRSEVGRHVAYELGKDPGALDKLNKLDYIDAARELIQIEAKFKKPAAETKPKVTQAPRPVKTVAGAVKAAPSLSDENISFEDYEKLRKKQLARK